MREWFYHNRAVNNRMMNVMFLIRDQFCACQMVYLPTRIHLSLALWWIQSGDIGDNMMHHVVSTKIPQWFSHKSLKWGSANLYYENGGLLWQYYV